ncbi:MAG TPA: tetratricopeptide repeat protein [Terriglobia bacterium]|nr:tetratricopeptide repeat protein [Terriglobia bacterium]
MRVFFVFAIAGALLLYSSGLWAPYHLDDGNTLNIAKTFDWSTNRVLGFATFWLNEQVALAFGAMFPWSEAFYQRLGNVFIHVLAATALFWLAKELTGRGLVAAVAGALFLVHPIQTQAVTYITQRFESQAAMFMLLSAAAYVRFRRTGGRRWFIAMLILGAAGGLTKQTAFVLPIWIVFIESVFFAGGAKLRKRVLYVSAIGLVLLFPVWKSLPTVFDSPTLKWIAPDQYWISQGPILARYFQLSTWPERQFLFYDFEPVRVFSWPVAAQWALVLIVLALGLYSLRRWPLIGFGIVSFFVLLLPIIILPVPDVINEHRLYPAFAGIALAAAGVYQAINRRSVLVVVGALVIAFGFKTFMRNAEWNDQFAFLEANRAAFPRDPGILSRLAAYYFQSGYVNKSLELNLEARRYEDRYNAYYRQLGHLLTSINLAAIYQAKGNLQAAKTEALRAVAANPVEPMAWQTLGQIQFQLGDYERAQQSFRRLVTLRPDSESLRSFQLTATRLGNTSLAAAIGKVLNVEEQLERSEEKPPFTIPAKYQTFVIFALTLTLLLGLASGLWTVWTACRTLLRQTAANSSPINEVRGKS